MIGPYTTPMLEEINEKETRAREHETARNGITDNEFRIRKWLAKDHRTVSIVDTTTLNTFDNEDVKAELIETKWQNGKTDYTVMLTVNCGSEEMFTFDNFNDAEIFFLLALKGS